MHFCCSIHSYNAIVCEALSFSSGAILYYHSGLRVNLPVSVRVSTRGKWDITVWGRWKVEPWASESVHRYNLFCYNFTFDLTTCFCFRRKLLYSGCHSHHSCCLLTGDIHCMLGLYVVYCSLSVSAGGTRRDVGLSQHQTHKNSSEDL